MFELLATTSMPANVGIVVIFDGTAAVYWPTAHLKPVCSEIYMD